MFFVVVVFCVFLNSPLISGFSALNLTGPLQTSLCGVHISFSHRYLIGITYVFHGVRVHLFTAKVTHERFSLIIQSQPSKRGYTIQFLFLIASRTVYGRENKPTTVAHDRFHSCCRPRQMNSSGIFRFRYRPILSCASGKILFPRPYVTLLRIKKNLFRFFCTERNASRLYTGFFRNYAESSNLDE